MKTSIVLLVFALSIMMEAITTNVLLAQKLLPPKPLLADEASYRSTYLVVRWDSVPGATHYILDVAEDSSFTKFLPGVQNFVYTPLTFNVSYKLYDYDFRGYGTFFPAYFYNNLAVIFGLTHDTQYYVRVRSANTNEVSEYSTTATFKTTINELFFTKGNRIRLQLGGIQVKKLTDTSISVRWKGSSDIREYEVTITPGNIKTIVQKPECEITGLQPGKFYSCQVLGRKYTGNSLTQEYYDLLLFTTFSSATVRYGDMIQYYQGPVHSKVPADRSTYYLWGKVPPRLKYNERLPQEYKMSSLQADSLMQVLLKAKLPLDTAWFHEWGGVAVNQVPQRCFDHPNDIYYCRYDTASSRLIVKLSKTDERMTMYGFQALPYTDMGFLWRYSDSFTYYRYIFNGTTNVQNTTNREVMQLHCHPNPSSELVNVDYTMPEAGVVLFQLYDLYGNILLSSTEKQVSGVYSKKFTISEFASGLYFLKASFTNGNGTVTSTTEKITILR